jgi:GDP-mannose pyrophosphatase NudK
MDNINILKTEILSNNWYTLKKVTFEGTQKDGSTLTQVREAYDRGNGSVILLYNPKQGTVILTRQFRLPTYINGNEDGMMIECCAGLLDDDNPEECIRRETEEETGYQIRSVQKAFELYMSPGSVTEILYFFVAEYDSTMKVNEGGGAANEHENIEVMELPFADAIAMIANGGIRDAKTVILLQYAQINKLLS